MNKTKQNIAIAKVCGLKPNRRWRVWYNDEHTHGSIDMTYEQALKCIEHTKEYWPELKTIGPEEYDEWGGCPDYCGDLNSMAEAEGILDEEHRGEYRHALIDILGTNWGLASAEQRAEAFLKVFGLWNSDQLEELNKLING